MLEATGLGRVGGGGPVVLLPNQPVQVCSQAQPLPVCVGRGMGRALCFPPGGWVGKENPGWENMSAPFLTEPPPPVS